MIFDMRMIARGDRSVCGLLMGCDGERVLGWVVSVVC